MVLIYTSDSQRNYKILTVMFSLKYSNARQRYGSSSVTVMPGRGTGNLQS